MTLKLSMGDRAGILFSGIAAIASGVSLSTSPEMAVGLLV